ncbi:MAG: MoaD/ThiS family protein [Gemmatimonadaceae bacterium]
MITLELPNVLCSQNGERSSVLVDDTCRTVGDALRALSGRSPGAHDRIMDERGNVRRHVNVFVNGENIRFLNGLSTPVEGNATITVIAAVSGG